MPTSKWLSRSLKKQNLNNMAKDTGTINRIATGHYITTYIDICRNCKGTGQCLAREPREDDVAVEICPVCEGSGRVVVTKEVKSTVKPYET